MKKIISFSGGIDSTTLIPWAKERLKDFVVVAIDTVWEHPLTYAYWQYINESFLNNELVILTSDKYNGFEDLCIKKKRVPSSQARYCTEHLKLAPMKKYIEQFLPDVEIYTGIRADESLNRSKLPERSFADYYGCDMVRPLLKWTKQECFDFIKYHGMEPNPLYKMGMKRVGCMPCVMVSHGELKNIIRQFPEVVEKIQKLENKLGRTFFPPDYIPERYCSGIDLNFKRFPTVADVVKYVSDDPDQIGLFPEEQGPSCMSYYSICE